MAELGRAIFRGYRGSQLIIYGIKVFLKHFLHSHILPEPRWQMETRRKRGLGGDLQSLQGTGTLNRTIEQSK